MAKCSACDKGKALHISQWIKGELGGGKDGFGFGPDADADEPTELWPAERMDAKRAEVMRRLLTTAEDAAETVSGCSQDDGQVRAAHTYPLRNVPGNLTDFST